MGFHLFAESGIWGSKSVPLAINGRGSTPSDGIHFPMGVVIVHHMEVSVPASAYVETNMFSSMYTIPTWIPQQGMHYVLDSGAFCFWEFTLAFFEQVLLQSD